MEDAILFSRNVKFCAFLRMKKVHPDFIKKLGRGKAEYGYKVTESVWADLKSEFDRSDFLTYAHCLDSIIDLAY